LESYGKPDATGRSSGVWTGKEKKYFGPPKGQPWVWKTSELIVSASWKMASINTRRLIDFLEIEHREHGGRENGRLMATYDQLVDFGLTRSEISNAVAEAEFLGLISVKRGGRWADTNQPSIYRLTYYASYDFAPPTNDWKKKTTEAIKRWKRERVAKKKVIKERRKNLISTPNSRTTVVRFSELPNRKTRGRQK
jgi:hypothetical protein